MPLPRSFNLTDELTEVLQNAKVGVRDTRAFVQLIEAELALIIGDLATNPNEANKNSARAAVGAILMRSARNALKSSAATRKIAVSVVQSFIRGLILAL